MKSAHVVYEGRAELAEGPLWYENALWWVDIAVGTLNRWDPRTGHNTSRATGGFLGAATPCSDGRWLLARQTDCALLNWVSGELTPFSATPDSLRSDHRFNDGKCGPAGDFWVGTLSLKQNPHEASLFVLNSKGQLHRARSGLTLANGLAWSPQGDRFYHVDTPTKRVQIFDFEADTGRLSNERTLIQFSDLDGSPDGLTCDRDGNLWIALWGGAAIVNVDGQTGQLIERHRLPVSQVSSCTFGGDEFSTLYITTAWEGFSLMQRMAEPLAGSIFALETQSRGQPATVFKLNG